MTFYRIMGALLLGLTLCFTACQDDTDTISPEAQTEETKDTAQRKRTCLTQEHTHHLLQNPEYQKEHDQRISAFVKMSRSRTLKMSCETPTLVPVAVHYQGVNNPDQSCLLEMAQRQIQVLNDDFAGTNSDINKWQNAQSTFPSVNNGEMCIKFVLADQNHPSGYGLTNGQPAVTINRTQGDNDSQWSGYLNIFVQSGTGVLGYAPLGGSGNGDGVVIDYVGWSTGSGCSNVVPEAPYVLGRTTTHEVGHYLLLDHIWGNGCAQDDDVADTPDQASDNSGCPALGISSCGSADLHMNYMDYTNDACMYMFSAGQVARMTNYLTASLTNLTNNVSNVYSGDTGNGGGGGTTCDAPTNVTAAVASSTSINVSWTGGQSASAYQVRYRPVDGAYQTTNASTTTKILSNLTPGTTYEIAVRAICGSDNSAYSTTITSATSDDNGGGGNGGTTCDAPVDELVTILSETAVQLDWSDIDGATRYRVRYRVIGTRKWTAQNTRTSEVVIDNLEPEVYEYQLRTRCGTEWTPFAAKRTFDLTSTGGGGGTTDDTYRVVLTLDNYGSETTWALYDLNNDLLAQAGPFEDGQEGLQFVEEVTLTEGCYEIDLFDSYGDGICCDYGQGKLEILASDDSIVAESDGYFGSYELIQFCIEDGRARIIKQDRDAKRINRGQKK